MSVSNLLDRPIAYHRVFVKLTHSVKAAILLSQAVYWQKRAKQADGWWYKTAEEWEDETGLTRHEQDTAREKSKKYLKTKLKDAPARLYWKVDEETLSEDLIAVLSKSSLPKSGKLDSRIPSTINKNTETTTETTTIIESANKKVDAIFENERKVQEKEAKRESWPYREKFPEPIRELLDVFVKGTGMRPAKKDIMDWLSTGQDWLDLGIIEADIKKAIFKSKGGGTNQGGFVVGRPGSLTNTANMYAGERRTRTSTSTKEDHTPEILKAKDDAIAKAVPRPANVSRPKISHPQPISEIMKGMQHD